jgi:hypothetical protein
MHPEIARELTAQRGRELRQQAQQAMVATMVSRALRAARRDVRGIDLAGPDHVTQARGAPGWP